MTLTLKPRFRRRTDRGASAVEYALVAALIAVVIIVAVVAFGGATTGLFQKTCSSVASAQGDTC